jgi:hypothetical protein
MLASRLRITRARAEPMPPDLGSAVDARAGADLARHPAPLHVDPSGSLRRVGGPGPAADRLASIAA